MIIYDDKFSWDGWGGKLKLGSGRCRLRIYDLKKNRENSSTLLRPIISVISDIPGGKMSVRSCSSHIATLVVEKFNIDPHRMFWVEYYPEKKYGIGNATVIPERFEAVEFVWLSGKAIKPKWRLLKPPVLDEVRRLLKEESSETMT